MPWRACLLLLLLLLLMTLGLGLAPATAWAQRELKDIPDPAPQREQESFVVAEGFEVNLYAADPMIAKPIQMNFDAQGRLWVASSEVYPHIRPGQQATDKILVLEDTDRDGRADQRTVFADDLLIPTGVIPGDGGAYVANSTELIHLSDTDGDGRADRRRVVLSGFGTEDTHHLLHTLRWGPDGALYMNQSIYIHSHVETPYGVRRLNGGGIWRFRPDTMELDVLCRGFVNPWGHHFDRWGQSFATDGAYGEGINYVFPGAVFVTAPGATRRVVGLNPGSPKHCGLEIVGGRHLPESWDGNMITNDFRAHRVCRFVVSEDGAGYASRQETELIKSTHVAFRPVDVKMGPDGAIYIADWYNPIIQHGEVDFRDPRRDQTHGRIWRVSAKGRPVLEPPQLADASVEKLLEVLKQPESWNRLHAKLILKQRGAEAVREPLRAWLAALDPADPESLRYRVEALWVYECLNEVNESLVAQLLASEDHRARCAALRVVGRRLEALSDSDRYLRQAVADPHPRVRLEGVRALARQGSAEAARLALHVLDQPMDRFLDFALWQTLRDLSPAWLPELQAGRPVLGENTEHLAYALRAVDSPEVVPPLLKLLRGGQVPADNMAAVVEIVASLGDAEQLSALLEFIGTSAAPTSAGRAASMLESLVETCRRRRIAPARSTATGDLLDHDSLELRAAAARAAGAWKLDSARPRLVSWASSDETTPQSLRSAALEALALFGGPEDVRVLAQVAEGTSNLENRIQALRGLASLNVRLAARNAVRLLTEFRSSQDPAPLLTALLQQKQGPAALKAALAGKMLDRDVAQLAVRAVQGSSQPDAELITALRTAGALDERRWKFDAALRDQLVAEVQSQGNAARGEAIYRRAELQCTKCHAIAGAGGGVGPDLVSIGASAPVDYLVESLLDPAAKVKENFHSLLIQDEDGKVVMGIPVRESERELVLRDAEDRLVTIPQDTILGRREGRSLMPDGTVDTLTRQELVDLVRFLSELGKVGPFSVGQRQFARRWEVLLPTPEALHRIRRTSFDTAASDQPDLQWEPVYSTVAGQLPLDELPSLENPTYVTRQQDNRTSFVRCRLEVSRAGTVRLRVNAPDHLRLWIDGKPRPLQTDMELNLEKGPHTLTWAVDRLQREQPFAVELLVGESNHGEQASASWTLSP